MAGGDQTLDVGDDLRDVLGDPRIVLGRLDAEQSCAAMVGGDVALGQLRCGGVLAPRPGDDLVIDIREILDEGDGVTKMRQVAANHVAGNEGIHVSQMRPVLDRHAADIDADLASADRNEASLAAGDRIVDP